MDHTTQKLICNACESVLQGVAEELPMTEDEDKWEDHEGKKNIVKYAHHATLDSFITALQSRCRMCVGLWNTIRSHTARQHGQNRNMVLLDPGFEAEVRATKVLNYLDEASRFSHAMLSRNHHMQTLDIMDLHVSVNHFVFVKGVASYIHPHCRCGYTLHKYNGDFSPIGLSLPGTGSTESMTTVKRWLETCDSGHDHCRDTQSADSFFPTRILNVAEQKCFRLVEGKHRATGGVDARYCTLSHCWGNMIDRLVLDRENQKALLAGVSYELLPKTFQDAVKVCQALGIQYLWIDSLCIMQDDIGDWNRESVMMESVYSHGYANISATASSDSTQGLFRDRLDQQTIVPVRTNTGKSKIGTGLFEILMSEAKFHFLDLNLVETPLQQRAWALQERLLSRRNLHFGPYEILWECQSNDASESFGMGHVMNDFENYDRIKEFSIPWSVQKQLYNAWAERFNVEKTESYPSNIEVLHQNWERIGEQYSRQRLTFAKDRPVALAGLAKRFERLLNDRLVFGLWESKLRQQLCWETERRYLDPSSRVAAAWPVCDAVPSWSWLSTEQPHSCFVPLHEQEIFTFQFEVLAWDTKPAHGGTGRPFAILRGNLGVAKVFKSDDNYVHITSLGGVPVTSAFVLDRPWMIPTNTEPDNEYACYYMPACCDTLAKNHYYFLLQRTGSEGKSSGTFRRLGFGTVHEDDGIAAAMGPQENAADLPCIAFDRETKRHDIYLE